MNVLKNQDNIYAMEQKPHVNYLLPPYNSVNLNNIKNERKTKNIWINSIL